MTTTTAVTTHGALDAISYERAPRYPGRQVNRRIICADGFKVSVQASTRHYANDSSGNRPYWAPDDEIDYPFTTFEVGNPSAKPEGLEEWDSEGVWAYVPRDAVERLLDAHGGATGWEVS